MPNWTCFVAWSLWGCTLLYGGLVKADALPVTSRSVGERTLRPEPWMFESPLQAEVKFAARSAVPWEDPLNAWISTDGKYVAFFTRGPPLSEGSSRRLVIKEVETDAVVLEKELFSAEESLQRGERFLHRLARLRTWEVAPQWANHDWQPLASRALSPDDKGFFSDSCYEKQLHPRRVISLEELKISYEEPRVQVWLRGKKLLDRQFSAWRLHQEDCQRASPSWLSRAFVSRVQGVILLELEFCGADPCPEPASAFHVFRIPRDTSGVHASAATQEARATAGPSLHYERADDVRKTLYSTGLPAISAENSLVAVMETVFNDKLKASDSLVNFRRLGSDELVKSMPLFTAEEVSGARGSPRVYQELERKVLERIRQINGYLDQTKWVPLVERPISPMVTESCQQAPSQRVQVGDRQLLVQQGHLRLEGGSAPPVEWDTPDAGPSTDAGTASGADPRGVLACGAAGRRFIDAAYAEDSAGVVLLRYSTCGDASCPETFGGYHSIRWH